jgi:hypothetical protein
MKYRSLEQIAPEADVRRGIDMSRRQRLERWAELLDRHPNRASPRSEAASSEAAATARQSMLTILRSP